MKVKREKISIVEFMRKYPTEESVRKQFEDWRWGDQKRCAHCDSVRISEAKNRKMSYRCKDCRKRFSPKTGTVMANSNLSYSTWLLAIYIAATGLKGTASTKLGSDVGCTQKSAWFLGPRIRKAWEQDGSILSDEVEVDESYFGGKERNKHQSKRTGNRGTQGKQAVIDMKERGGGVIAKAVDEATAEVLQSEIKRHVKSDASIYTDEHRGYRDLTIFEHQSVTHSVGEYVRDQVHTNGIESFWSLLKRGYYGTHHVISQKHIQQYVSEFSARQTVRKHNTIDIMKVIAQGMVGRQPKYKELIA